MSSDNKASARPYVFYYIHLNILWKTKEEGRKKRELEREYLCSGGPFNVLYYPWKVLEGQRGRRVMERKSFSFLFSPSSPPHSWWPSTWKSFAFIPNITSRNLNSFIMRAARLASGIYLEFIKFLSFSLLYPPGCSRAQVLQPAAHSMTVNKLSYIEKYKSSMGGKENTFFRRVIYGNS